MAARKTPPKHDEHGRFAKIDKSEKKRIAITIPTDSEEQEKD